MLLPKAPFAGLLLAVHGGATTHVGRKTEPGLILARGCHLKLTWCAFRSHLDNGPKLQQQVVRRSSTQKNESGQNQTMNVRPLTPPGLPVTFGLARAPWRVHTFLGCSCACAMSKNLVNAFVFCPPPSSSSSSFCPTHTHCHQSKPHRKVGQRSSAFSFIDHQPVQNISNLCTG